MTISEEFVTHITELAQSVVDLHERFGIQPTNTYKNPVPLENMKFRNQLLTEEVGEVARALNHGDYEQAVLESVDVAYVALGTLLSHSPESFVHITEVIRKNFDKDLSTHRLDEGGKVVKKTASDWYDKGTNYTKGVQGSLR